MMMWFAWVRWRVRMLQNAPTARDLTRHGLKPPGVTPVWTRSHLWSHRMTHQEWPRLAHFGISWQRAGMYRSTISGCPVAPCPSTLCSLMPHSPRSCFLMPHFPTPSSMLRRLPRMRYRRRRVRRAPQQNAQNAVCAHCDGYPDARSGKRSGEAARLSTTCPTTRRQLRFVPRVPACQSPQFSRCASSACNSTGPIAVISPAPTVNTTSP